MKKIILENIKAHKQILKDIESSVEVISRASVKIIDCLKNRGKVLIFGNGGSAADSQHIAAELVGRFQTERAGLPAIALTTDSSALTSIANDFGYENIFSRQIEALASEDDLVIGISTSGNSNNVINGLQKAKEIGCFCIGLSGSNGGHMNDKCDINIVVPSDQTARIQEMHILVGHIICDLVDKEFN